MTGPWPCVGLKLRGPLDDKRQVRLSRFEAELSRA
jgi:hypothetical protein